MSCKETIICKGTHCSCAESFELDLIAPSTGIYEMKAKFNGVIITRQIEVIANQNIRIVNVFNECYTTIISFFDSNSEPVFETSFSIKTLSCINTE